MMKDEKINHQISSILVGQIKLDDNVYDQTRVFIEHWIEQDDYNSFFYKQYTQIFLLSDKYDYIIPEFSNKSGMLRFKLGYEVTLNVEPFHANAERIGNEYYHAVTIEEKAHDIDTAIEKIKKYNETLSNYFTRLYKKNIGKIVVSPQKVSCGDQTVYAYASIGLDDKKKKKVIKYYYYLPYDIQNSTVARGFKSAKEQLKEVPEHVDDNIFHGRVLSDGNIYSLLIVETEVNKSVSEIKDKINEDLSMIHDLYPKVMQEIQKEHESVGSMRIFKGYKNIDVYYKDSFVFPEEKYNWVMHSSIYIPVSAFDNYEQYVLAKDIVQGTNRNYRWSVRVDEPREMFNGENCYVFSIRLDEFNDVTEAEEMAKTVRKQFVDLLTDKVFSNSVEEQER